MSRKKLIPELAVYEGELPPPLELAKIAAAVGPHDKPDEAIRKATRLYLQAVEFCQTYEKASVEERARMFGDNHALLLAAAYKLAAKHQVPESPATIDVPPLTKTPATLNDFLNQVVKRKTPADSTKRLRDFFRAQCPKNSDPDTYAAEQIQQIKEKGFTYDEVFYWDKLGRAYLSWWKQEKSNKATQSGKKPKKLKKKKSTNP